MQGCNSNYSCAILYALFSFIVSGCIATQFEQGEPSGWEQKVMPTAVGLVVGTG